MEKIDQYQLGLLGIELLTGRMPCTFQDIEELAEPPTEAEFRKRTETGLDLKVEKLHRIFHRMTEPSAQKRYPDLAAAIAEISESALQPLDIRRVRNSYLRSLNAEVNGIGFLKAFYRKFMEDRNVKEKFQRFGLQKENTEVLQRQYNHLQGALFGLIEYASMIAEGKERDEIKMLEHIAKKHGKGGKRTAKDSYYINISPAELYWFKSALIQIVCGKSGSENEAFDAMCRIDMNERENIKRAWEKVLETGIEYFTLFIE